MYGSQTLYKSDDGGEVPSVGERWESLQGSHFGDAAVCDVACDGVDHPRKLSVEGG